MKHEIINCIDIINYLASHHTQLAKFNFNAFSSYDLLQERIDIEGELKTVFERALALREQTNLPFWDSFNVSIFGKRFRNFDFFEEIKFHNPPIYTHSITRESVSYFLSEQQKIDDYLTVCSDVILSDGSRNHIPLIDFHIPVSDENEAICEATLKALDLKGFLLNSGKSYHFYGISLIDEPELINLLSRSLLFAPIIDRSWIAHQLIEKKCSLRISRKYSSIPFKIRDI